MISYKRDVLERKSLQSVKECIKKIVEYLWNKNNVTQCQIPKAL